MKRWFVIQTKSGQERIAETNLLRQGFEVYLPRTVKRTRHKRRGVATVTIPLFPRYLFVRVDLDAAPWRSINGTYGVANLISFGERPAALADAIIDEIKGREDETGNISLVALDSFKPGEKLEIAEGPFKDHTGIFQCKTDRERVIVLLNLLGRDVSVKVDPMSLSRVA